MPRRPNPVPAHDLTAAPPEGVSTHDTAPGPARATGDTHQSAERRRRAYRLVDELRLSSDDLTRLAHDCHANVDAMCARQHQETRDDRSGELPRRREQLWLQLDTLRRRMIRTVDQICGDAAGVTPAGSPITPGPVSRVASFNTVIDAIAFQMNLLALNAAVEAARACDGDREFAIAADQVRSLARRAAAAAREIKGLVSGPERLEARAPALG